MTVGAGSGTAVHAQTWDGGGADNNWTTANNWFPNGVPVNDGTANIVFRGSIRLTPMVNFSQSVLSIAFASPAGSFDITNPSRFSLTIGAGGITNGDDSLQTISCPVELGAAQTWRSNSGPLSVTVVTGNGFPLTIDGNSDTTIGRIIGSGTSLTKNGTGTLTLNNASTYPGGTLVTAGALQVSNSSGASATGPGPVLVASGATLLGTGSIGGPVQNDGTVRPGASPGTLTIQNTYTQGAGGSLSIEIGGPGTGNDQLSVAGTATLSGALAVTLINGYTPQRGDSFDILTAGAISGQFATVTLPPLPIPRIWVLTYQPTAVRLTATDSAAVTYQGRLRDGTQPANGLHDFQFRLFDAPSGGTQIGATQCADNVAVTEGLFSAVFDFGSQYATPAPRFLEIHVRGDTGLDCSNSSGFSALPARQAILPVPLASHADTAFALDAPDGSPSGAVFVDNAGQIGIGTSAPQASVHVVTTDAGVAVQGSSVGAPNTAWIGFRDAAGTETGNVGDWSVGDSSICLTSDSGDVHVYAASAHVLTAARFGAVGIGTSAPVATLDVRGDIALGPSGQFRAAAGEETLRIVRGVIDRIDGTILAGSGFTVSHPSTGQYNVTFITPFSATPAVTATAQGLGSDFFSEAFVMTQSVTPSGANLQVLARHDGSFIPRTVHFIAIGPR